MYIQEKNDDIHKGILNIVGISESIEFDIFVDGCLFFDIKKYIHMVLVSNIKALYIIFGYIMKEIRAKPFRSR